MRIIQSACAAGLALWTGIGLSQAKDSTKKIHSPKEQPDRVTMMAVSPAPVTAARSPTGKEPWIKADVIFSPREREIVQEYVLQHQGQPSQGKKAKSLPPGLQKKVARGRPLPPGWEKKIVGGEIMPREVYQECQPLPKDLEVKMPPPPKGTVVVVVSGKLVRLWEATREILDVFDVHL